MVTFMNTDMFPFGDQILFWLAQLGCNDYLALALGILTEGDNPVDLGDNGIILRFSCLEQLRDPWETTGNILGLGGFSGNLGNYVAGIDDGVLLNGDVCTHGEKVASHHGLANPHRLARFVLQGNARTLVRVAGLNDYFAGETGNIIQLLLHGNPFDNVAKLDLTANLSKNRHGVRVPFGEALTRLYQHVWGSL